MTSSHAQILNLLADGQISPEEAAARMRGERGTSESSRPQPGAPRAAATADLGKRWLHIRISDAHTGRARVNVNLPLGWVALGLQLGARYKLPQLADIDLGEILDQIRSGASGKLVEVEDLDDGERVEIYVD